MRQNKKGNHLKGTSNASIVRRKGTSPVTATALEEPNKGTAPKGHPTRTNDSVATLPLVCRMAPGPQL